MMRKIIERSVELKVFLLIQVQILQKIRIERQKKGIPQLILHSEKKNHNKQKESGLEHLVRNKKEEKRREKQPEKDLVQKNVNINNYKIEVKKMIIL